MKRMLKLILVLVSIAVLGCSSSKDVVYLPGPPVESEYYSGWFKPFKETVYRLVYVEVTRKNTGETRRYQQDRQIEDFLKKGEPYNFIWYYTYLDGSKSDYVTKTDVFLYSTDKAVVIKLGETKDELIELPY